MLCHSLTPAAKATTPTRKEPVLPGRRKPVSAAAPEAANAPIARTRRNRPRPFLPPHSPSLAPPAYFCRTVVTSGVYGSVASLSLFLPVCGNDWPHSVRGGSGGNLTTWISFFPEHEKSLPRTGEGDGLFPRGFHPAQGRYQRNGSMGRKRNNIDRRMGGGLL